MHIIRARDAEQKQQRRQTLIDAGWAIYLESDGQLPSVAQISARAGLAKGTFYIYFKTKEELFVELVAAAMDELFLKLNTYLDQPDSTLHGCIEVFINAVGREDPIIKLGPMLTGVLERNTEPAIIIGFKRRLVANLLHCGQNLARRFPGLDAHTAARTLMRSYAIVLGVAQILPSSHDVNSVLQQEEFAPIRLSLAEDATAIIALLWQKTLEI
ncbi:MAG: TetR family transcriptional regulator [Pseudomonadota bacterium]